MRPLRFSIPVNDPETVAMVAMEEWRLVPALAAAGSSAPVVVAVAGPSALAVAGSPAPVVALPSAACLGACQAREAGLGEACRAEAGLEEACPCPAAEVAARFQPSRAAARLR